MMNVTGLLGNRVSFGNKENEIVKPKNRLNTEALIQVHERLGQIVKELGGISTSGDFKANILKTEERIKQLRKETEDAWGTCPSALKQKLEALEKIENEVKALEQQFQVTNEKIDNEPDGLILPDSVKDKKEGLITDSLDVMSAYNRLPKSTSDALAALKGQLKPKQTSGISITELKEALEDLDNDKWDFEKLNAKDSQAYSKMQGCLLIGKLKEIVNEQIKTIDTKLADLKENKGVFVPTVGVKIYSPETTGKILALETARLRRSTLSDTIAVPGVHEYLDKPDVFLQPLPDSAPIPFKIDKSFVPNNQEIKEILTLNQSYKPVLDKMFPEGLPVYIVPGYINDKYGDIEGGMSIPGHPETGVWLNSYNNEERYMYTSMMEKNMGRMRGLTRINPSVIDGNKDRARALAHEIGHAISYKMMKDEALNNSEKSSSGILLDTNLSLDFMTAWKGLRNGVEYNNHEADHHETRLMANQDKEMLLKFVDYETIAEDIRIAITAKDIPASSKMTGIFDQQEKGKVQQEKVTKFIQECLLEGKPTSEALINNM